MVCPKIPENGVAGDVYRPVFLVTSGARASANGPPREGGYARTSRAAGDGVPGKASKEAGRGLCLLLSHAARHGLDGVPGAPDRPEGAEGLLCPRRDEKPPLRVQRRRPTPGVHAAGSEEAH